MSKNKRNKQTPNVNEKKFLRGNTYKNKSAKRYEDKAIKPHSKLFSRVWIKTKEWLSDKKALVVFLMIFSSIISLYYILLGTKTMINIIDYYSTVTVYVSTLILNIFGENAYANGNMLSTPKTTLLLGMGCEGSEVMVMLLGAIIAFPARWLHKITGAATGFVFLFILNQLRVIGLYLVDINYKSSFVFMHEELFPLIFTILSIFYLIFWIKLSYKDRINAQSPAK